MGSIRDFQFKKHWIALPLLSGFLLLLSFYPFELQFLSFIALVPIFLFLNAKDEIPGKKIFWGGFIFGAFFSLILSLFIFFKFIWLEETYLFVWIVRLLPLFIAAITGTIFGFSFLAYKRFSSGKPTDIFVLAAIYTLAEIVQFKIFFGLNSGLLAYTVYKFLFFLKFSSITGVFGISFIIALINSFIAYFVLRPEHRKQVASLALASFAVIFTINAANNLYLKNDEDYKTAKFSIIQNSDRKNVFGNIIDGKFHLPYQGLISEAKYQNPDFIIYPFSPFNGYLSSIKIDEIQNSGLKKEAVIDSENFDKWIGKLTGTDTFFINWVNVIKDEKVYPEMIFWQNGKQIAEYQKRITFPFFDYTPEFFKKIGLFTTPIDALQSLKNNLPIQINDIKFEPLICSELFESKLIRKGSLNSNILLSIGSDASFSNEVPDKWHLTILQFEAAGNNRPIVKANLFGSSVLIDENGKIIKEMKFNKTGVLTGELQYKKSPKNTFYGYFGDLPFIIAIVLFLTVYMASEKFNYRREK
ncbi:MAG: nitrilase-related carbon-nitrogen hydrolase [Candidatus Paceibacterota bacterium]